jgi:hypothetical protein
MAAPKNFHPSSSGRLDDHYSAELFVPVFVIHTFMAIFVFRHVCIALSGFWMRCRIWGVEFASEKSE